MKVRDLIEALCEEDIPLDYKVLLAGSLNGAEDGVILSIYPDAEKKTVWIDVADEGDETV